MPLLHIIRVLPMSHLIPATFPKAALLLPFASSHLYSPVAFPATLQPSTERPKLAVLLLLSFLDFYPKVIVVHIRLTSVFSQFVFCACFLNIPCHIVGVFRSSCHQTRSCAYKIMPWTPLSASSPLWSDSTSSHATPRKNDIEYKAIRQMFYFYHGILMQLKFDQSNRIADNG